MHKFGTRTLFVFTAIVALICALVVPVIQSARQATLGMSCRNNLKQVGLALLNYESAFRSPSAVPSPGKGLRPSLAVFD